MDCEKLKYIGGRCTCGLEPEYLVFTLSDTSKESLEKAVELYNQKQWYEI
jgi:hypothetical protein